MINDTTLVILTRNEINGLKALIKKIPLGSVKECFAVDYNSTDGTVEYFKKHNIRVLKQQKPGRGEAFNIAVKNSNCKYIIFFSPDGNENPKDIPNIINRLNKGFDLVIASRFMKGSRNEEDGKVLKFRAWANRCFSLLANVIWNGKVTDTINGYRGIKKSSYKKLHLDANGFAIEFQMTIRAMKLKMKITELPTREGDRIGGKSGSRAIPTGLKFIYYMLREIRIGNGFISRKN